MDKFFNQETGRQIISSETNAVEDDFREAIEPLFEEAVKRFGVTETTLMLILLIEEIRAEYILSNNTAKN